MSENENKVLNIIKELPSNRDISKKSREEREER